MASEFSREFFSANRIVKADLHCARQPREQDLDKIKAELKSLYDATEVLLDVSVDESLLSGYILQVGDRVFDNSGRHALDQMTGDKPDLATLKTRVEDYKPAANTAEGGMVVSAADGIVTVEGMDRAVYGEIVTFENGAKGMVESVEPSHLGIMLFDGAESVGVGTLVTRTGKRAGIPVGEAFLGRVINPLGEPIDGKGAIEAVGYNPIEKQAPGILERQSVDTPLHTGILAIDAMCKDEVFGIKRYGTAEKIKAATAESLCKAWQNLLKTAKFEILYIGDSPADKAKEVFAKAFANIERNVVTSSTDVVKNVSKEKHITEEMELSQSKLVMGFRTQISAGDEEAVAERLMCAVLGGTASSKLFNNVREKQSLCYYCSSSYDSIKGIMYINSGVEGENLEKAEKAILKEIEDMKNGEITDFEIEATKLAVVNSFKSSSDSVSGIENWYTGRIFNGDLETVEEVSAEVNAVTKEQIVNAANKLLLDTVYVLKNK